MIAAMQLDELKRYLAARANIDVPAEMARFHRETGLQDFDHFLGWLHEQRAITSDTFRDLHGRAPIALARGVRETMVLGANSGQASMSPDDQATTLLAQTVDEQATKPATRNGSTGAFPPTSALAPSGDVQNPDRRGYEMLGEIASGAMGQVLVARDRELMRKVAYKRMLPHLLGDADLSSRFLGEVQITAQLDHPNIVPIHELEVTPDGRLGYSMKLIQGETLTKLIKRHIQEAFADKGEGEAERLDQRLDWFQKVADAMAYAHDKGVLHRDLKPDNVMVGRFNEVYVMDWGICRLIGEPVAPDERADRVVDARADTDHGAPSEPSGLPPERPSGAIKITERHAYGKTSYGAIMGTPGYMSPEQAQGRVPELDRRSDVYALGLILFELVCLRPAITGANVTALLARAAAGENDRLVHVLPRQRVARELRAIVAKATTAELAQRYQSVDDLVEDLRCFLRGEAVSAEPDSVLQTMQRWIGRHKMWTLSLMLFLLLAGAAATITMQMVKERQVTAAHESEERIQAFLLTISQRSHHIDSYFFELEKYQEKLAGEVKEVLAQPAPERAAPDVRDGEKEASPVTFQSRDFERSESAPGDLAEAPYYGYPVSTEHAVIKLAPGLSAETSGADMRTVARLRDPFVAMMLATSGDDVDVRTLQPARRRTLIAERGTVVLHVFVTLKNGVHVAYPGKGGYPPEYDGRDRPKYTLSAERRGIQWGNPFSARSGRGLILPSSTSIYDARGEFLGVTGIEVTFEWIRNNLLTVSDAPYVEATFLVDGKGRVVIANGRRPRAPGGQSDDRLSHASLELQPLPYPEVISALAESRAGSVALVRDGRDQIVAYYPIHALGWSYVAVADRAALDAADRSTIRSPP